MTRTLAHDLVDQLYRAGVEIAFGLDDPQALFAALRKSPIKTVIVHDERSGGFMADGYYRTSGRPAVAAGISGPGATNLATPLLEAYEASSLLVAVVGEAVPTSPGKKTFQNAPHEELLGPLAGSTVYVNEATSAKPSTYEAIVRSTLGRVRPVLVLADAQELWNPGVTDSSGQDSPTLASVTVDSSIRSQLGAAVAALREARRPVMLAGNGVHRAKAYVEVQEAAEVLGLPVATSMLGKGAIAETHPLSIGVASSYTGGAGAIGEVANQLVGAADVLLVVGSDLDPITTSNSRWPTDDTMVIQIDIDPNELSSSDVGLVGDAADVLAAIVGQATGNGKPSVSRNEWLEDVQRQMEQVRERVRKFDMSFDRAGSVWPGAVMQGLSDLLSGGDIVVTDASYSSAWALDRIRSRAAGPTVLAPRGTGVLGWGFPAALGAQLATGDGRVVCVTGDGGLLFSLAELETAKRENLPITLILLNNEQYGFQRHADLFRQGIEYADLAIEFVDWPALVRSFGWESMTVDDNEQLIPSLKWALASPEPTFVEVAIDQSDYPPLASFSEHAGQSSDSPT